MKRLILFLTLIPTTMLLAILFAQSVLAADGASGNSLTIATILVVGWGYVAPLTVYKWIDAEDARMKGITVAVSFLIAAAALFFGGGLAVDWHSAASIYAFGLLVYGEQQLVWTLLSESKPKAVK